MVYQKPNFVHRKVNNVDFFYLIITACEGFADRKISLFAFLKLCSLSPLKLKFLKGELDFERTPLKRLKNPPLSVNHSSNV